MMVSINSRLTLASGFVLVAFFGLTGLVLDNSFVSHEQRARLERLQAYSSALIAAAEPNELGAVNLAYALPETRFFIENSGLIGRIRDNGMSFFWTSPSTGNLVFSSDVKNDVGETSVESIYSQSGEEYYFYHVGVNWSGRLDPGLGYTVSTGEAASSYNNAILAFRKMLWGALALVSFILLVAQQIVLKWGLSPLRKVEREIVSVESGVLDCLSTGVPKELQGVATNLNALIRSERRMSLQYRKNLGNLAHSLKTPLALVRGAVGPDGRFSQPENIVQDQIDRMSNIIDYQLQHASTSSASVIKERFSFNDLYRKISNTLLKVYESKSVKCISNIPDNLMMVGGESDFFEMLGNLMDNAFKWSNQTVKVSAKHVKTGKSSLKFTVEDDGSGFDLEKVGILIKRGQRDDKSMPGQGIGLAIVDDIVKAYNGKIEVESSRLGGLKVSIFIPH